MKIVLEESQAIINEILQSNGKVHLFPKGTSMLPLIRQGKDSILLIKPTRDYFVGDIVLYKRLDKSFVLHRIIGADKEGYMMCGDAQTHIEKSISDKQIIGLVKEIKRGNKSIDDKSFTYRCYKWLWTSILVRRIYIKIQRGGNRLIAYVRKEEK